MSTIEIRRADRTDHAALLELHRALNVHTRAELIAPHRQPLHAYRDWDRVVAEDLRTMLRSPQCRVLVATRSDESLLGYITGHVVSQPQRVLHPKGVVGDWYVVAEARNEGVGEELLHAMLAWFRSEGCQVVESATLPDNARARQVHDHLGFDEVQVRYRMRL